MNVLSTRGVALDVAGGGRRAEHPVRSAAHDHREILNALKARDQREAAQAMRRHLRHVAEMLVIDPL